MLQIVRVYGVYSLSNDMANIEYKDYKVCVWQL